MSYKFNVEKATEECVKWIKDWFQKNGPECKAVIGISGGKDSSVVAALCCKALGKERVFGVLMPEGTQTDIDDSYQLCDHLGIQNITVDISPAIRALKHQIKPELGDHWSLQTSINLPPRIRMATLYAVSQTVNGRVVGTCNLSERYIGYFTRWGDGASDCEPLAYLTVQEVKAVGHYLGLPNNLIEKAPADGLCGKTDEDNLGLSYKEIDACIRSDANYSEENAKKISQLFKKNAFKIINLPMYCPSPEALADNTTLLFYEMDEDEDIEEDLDDEFDDFMDWNEV